VKATQIYIKALPQDLLAGVVVFLVALPLCLGVPLASGAPPIPGIMAGIVGGMLVVWFSGSHTSVNGQSLDDRV
jgi:MFS superfamily sulfate permease-like transporter